ncbi:MAG: helix-turn-helix transcriptional regulator [Rhodobiaceae bacterium]|nr:helix-turn-helix transcriptional regulator [Rhodobiaceae bacterium]
MREPKGEPARDRGGKKAGADKARAKSKCDESTTCPIAATVSVLGDRWSILVLRDLLLGLRRFDELVKSLGIATNILTDRLNKLSAEGLVTRSAYQSNPPRHEYQPTEAGEAFKQVIFAMAEWGKTWRMEPSGRTPVQYVSDRTGNPVVMRLIDEKTGEETPYSETTGILTEWANDKAEWRIAAAEAHRSTDKTKKT